MVQVYKLCFSAVYIEVRPCIFPSSCRNEGGGANRVPDTGDDGSSCAVELKEGGGWVVGVAVWVLETIEGGTLVPGQRYTVLDTQWQVGLESEESQNSLYRTSTEGESSH